MLLSKLLFDGEYQSNTPCENINIEHISRDINDLSAATLFICIRGKRFDTHSILSSLPRTKVAAVIVEEGVTIPAVDIPILTVSSTRAALSVIWNRYVGTPTEKLKFIGVTGTNGKTSTVYLTDTILRTYGYHTATVGTLGLYIDGERIYPSADTHLSTMTTPDPDILYPFLKTACDVGVTHVVMEVSSHALMQERVAPIIFEDCLFTNLSPEHLDYHHTMEEYAETKKKLFRQTKHATVNCDDSCGIAIATSLTCDVTRCGILWEGDANATHLVADTDGTYTYFYSYLSIRQLVKLRIIGNYQVYNSILALSSAIHLGIPAGIACRALASVESIPGRLEEVSSSDDDIRVFIDFAHTETALKSLITEVKRTAEANVILVFGCGGDRDVSKRPLMGACAMKYADYTIITSDNSRTEDTSAIIKGILTGHTSPESRRVIPEREAAIRYAILNAGKGDTVILAGKGHEEYEIKKDGIHPFSETKIAHEALAERRQQRRRREV